MKIVFKDIKNKFSRETKIVGVFAAVLAFFTHYYGFTQKLLNEDTLAYTIYEEKHYALGRWCEIYPTSYVSPSMNLFGLILMITIGSVLIVKILDFKSVVNACIAVGLVVTFPTVAYYCGYTGYVLVFTMSWFFSVVAVWVTKEYKYGFLPGGIILGLSMGQYQSYVAFSAGLCVLILILSIFENQIEIREWLKLAGRLLTMGILGAILYWIGLQVTLKVYNVELSSYKGLDSMGEISLDMIPELVSRTYSSFIGLFKGETFFYASNSTIVAYIVMFIVGLIILVKKIIDLVKEQKYFYVVALVSLVCVLPLVLNIIDLIAPATRASTLNIWQIVLCPVLIIKLVDTINGNEAIIAKLVKWSVLVCAILVISEYYEIDNVYYLKQETISKRSEALWNRVMTRMEMTDGYRDDLSLLVLSSDRYTEDGEMIADEFSVIMEPYDQGLAGYISVGPWPNFKTANLLNNLFGTSFKGASDTEKQKILETEEYLEMDVWPAENSVKVINDTVVVNFDYPVVADISVDGSNLIFEANNADKVPEFSFAWYIYKDGVVIEKTGYSKEIFKRSYEVTESGQYRVLLFMKKDDSDYVYTRTSEVVEVVLTQN